MSLLLREDSSHGRWPKVWLARKREIVRGERVSDPHGLGIAVAGVKARSFAAGVGMGVAFPNLFEAIAAIKYASVNPVVAVFIRVMFYPRAVNVDFASLKDVAVSVSSKPAEVL